MCSIKADRLLVFSQKGVAVYQRGLRSPARGRGVTGRPPFEGSDSTANASQLEI